MSSLLPQLIVNGLIAGSIYALAASGFSLVYHVIKFLNFAQGAIITISAYSFFAFFGKLGLGFIGSLFLTFAASILSILIINFLIFSQLRKRKSTNVVLMISSIAILVFTSSLMLAVFGSGTKTINIPSKILDFGSFSITTTQIVIILTAILTSLFLIFLLKKTRMGKAMRALSNNKDVAKIVGINPEKIYLFTFIIASILGAISGILIGIEQNVYPKMGVIIIIKGFISAVVGGITSVPGSIAGGFLIGLVENLGIWYLPSGYKDVISFTVLLIFLLFRPQGLFGVRQRDDS